MLWRGVVCSLVVLAAAVSLATDLVVELGDDMPERRDLVPSVISSSTDALLEIMDDATAAPTPAPAPAPKAAPAPAPKAAPAPAPKAAPAPAPKAAPAPAPAPAPMAAAPAPKAAVMKAPPSKTVTAGKGGRSSRHPTPNAENIEVKMYRALAGAAANTQVREALANAKTAAFAAKATAAKAMTLASTPSEREAALKQVAVAKRVMSAYQTQVRKLNPYAAGSKPTLSFGQMEQNVERKEVAAKQNAVAKGYKAQVSADAVLAKKRKAVYEKEVAAAKAKAAQPPPLEVKKPVTYSELQLKAKLKESSERDAKKSLAERKKLEAKWGKEKVDAVEKQRQAGLAVLKAARERAQKRINIAHAKLKLVKQNAALEKEKLMIANVKHAEKSAALQARLTAEAEAHRISAEASVIAADTQTKAAQQVVSQLSADTAAPAPAPGAAAAAAGAASPAGVAAPAPAGAAASAAAGVLASKATVAVPTGTTVFSTKALPGATAGVPATAQAAAAAVVADKLAQTQAGKSVVHSVVDLNQVKRQQAAAEKQLQIALRDEAAANEADKIAKGGHREAKAAIEAARKRRAVVAASQKQKPGVKTFLNAEAALTKSKSDEKGAKKQALSIPSSTSEKARKIHRQKQIATTARMRAAATKAKEQSAKHVAIARQLTKELKAKAVSASLAANGAKAKATTVAVAKAKVQAKAKAAQEVKKIKAANALKTSKSLDKALSKAKNIEAKQAKKDMLKAAASELATKTMKRSTKKKP